MILEAMTLLLIGDSITAGVVSEPTGPSWAEIISTQYVIENVAFGGSATPNWLHPCGHTQMHHDAATILPGSGDALYQDTAPDDYEANLILIVDRILEGCADRVILMAPPRNFDDISLDPLLEEYGERVGQICTADPDVDCGPDLFGLLDVSDFNPPEDGLHPNRFGHATIAAALLPEPAASPSWLAALLALAAYKRSSRARNL